MSSEKAFEKLEIPRKDLSQAGNNRYRVYQDEMNYSIVEAPNAIEALKVSGLQKAFRIRSDLLCFIHVLDTKSFVPAATVSEMPQAPDAPVNEIPPVEKAPAATAEVLSNADVDRLLQG